MRTYKTDVLWLKSNWKNLVLIIVGIAMIVTILKNFGTDDSKSLSEWKSWQKTAETAVNFGNKKEREAEELKKKQQAESVKVAKLEISLLKTKANLVFLDRENTSLYNRLKKEGTLDTSLVIERFKPVITLAKNQKIEIDTLKNVIVTDSTIKVSLYKEIDWLGNAYKLSDLRGDSLTTVLANQPKLLPTECKFLRIINCPSRKQTFVLGILGGIGTVVGGKYAYEQITK